MRRLASELMVHFRNLVVWQSLGQKAGDTLEITDEQARTLEAQAKLCDSSRIFRIADRLVEMDDKLRYALSCRTMIEMTLLRAGRIASVATVEELMRAVRTLQAQGGTAAPAAPNTSPSAASQPAPKPSPGAHRQAILDDPRLGEMLKAMPGSKIISIKD